MLTIRLSRIGKKKRPFYRVIVTEKTRPRNGRFVEIVGTYDPLKTPAAHRTQAGPRGLLDRQGRTAQRHRPQLFA